MNLDALIRAVRSGDIQAAQALLPDDPILKRAREIAAKHYGEPCEFISGRKDDSPQVRAIVEALETQEAVLRRVESHIVESDWLQKAARRRELK